MNSSEIRQSFLDFFASKQHAIVPSASLMPTSPNLLFTNAGMNQFVPYFLGERSAPFKRAADTQKCIRAGGKHNDLEDVGFDTYHHTLFEMLGNWSFGDYFKVEAIEWAWELLTKVWKMPKHRLYATVYKPGEGDPAAFDQEAYDVWARIFTAEGLDPKTHIVYGNKKDNFWMMGETGPCGPCSEIHIDLTEKGETKGELVNAGSPWCIEIWNLVFMEFNANPDGSFTSLPAKNVDTGMGFERVSGIIATTNHFKDFSRAPSNYNSDLFTDIFAEISKMSGHKYGYTMPADRDRMTTEEMNDCAFRVLGDHIRTLSFSIADGILPGNEGRNYVLRRILRRAVMFGKRIQLPSGFFAKLVDPLVEKMGSVFPELKAQQKNIRKIIMVEENAFEQTLERGLKILEAYCDEINLLKSTLHATVRHKDTDTVYKMIFSVLEGHGFLRGKLAAAFNRIYSMEVKEDAVEFMAKQLAPLFLEDFSKDKLVDVLRGVLEENLSVLPGKFVFSLYDTYGFPFDLTQLLAREKGFTIDEAGAEAEMEKQRSRARAAQKKTIIRLADDADTDATVFNGYDEEKLSNFDATVTAVVEADKDVYLILDSTPFYAEMGGQIGDSGYVAVKGETIEVLNTIKDEKGRYLHKLAKKPVSSISVGERAVVSVDILRRKAIQRHHSATHLLDWALRKVLGDHVRQAGSLVEADRLRFDYSHFEALTAEQIAEVEKLCNEMVLANYSVNWYETEFDNKPKNCIAVFGEKYGSVVRVVDIGGISVELCGGTHAKATGEIGFVKIVSEAAIAAGTRRIEAIAGESAIAYAAANADLLNKLSRKLSCKPNEIEKRVEAMLEAAAVAEKEMRRMQQKNSANVADELAQGAVDRNGIKWLVAKVAANDANEVRALGVNISRKLGDSVVILALAQDGKVTVMALCSEKAVASGIQAGSIVREITGKLGGKGGGKPDFAMGGGTDVANLDAVLSSYR